MKDFLLLSLLCILTACKVPVAQKHLLVIGDSNGERQGWVQQLQDLRGGGPLVNTSISGNTIGYKYGGGNLRLNTLENVNNYLRNGYAKMGQIDDILIALGTNDCKVEFGQDGADIGRQLQKLLDAINTFFTDRGQEVPRIVILSPPPLNDGGKEGEFRGAAPCVETVTNAYRTIAAARGHCFVDLQRQPGQAALEYSSDGIHYNQEGYILLAEAILNSCY